MGFDNFCVVLCCVSGLWRKGSQERGHVWPNTSDSIVNVHGACMAVACKVCGDQLALACRMNKGLLSRCLG